MVKEESKFFSERELKTLKLLGKKKLTLRELSDELFGDKVMNGQIMMASLVSRIQKKCKFYELDWTLTGVGRGRAENTVWLSSARTK